MIIIYDKSQTARFIRPCPFINIVWNGNFNEDGAIGGSYDITLTGSILDNHGSPIVASAGPNSDATWAARYDEAVQQHVAISGELESILKKQVALRELFDNKCLKVEVCSIKGDEPIITFFPQITSINFSEDVWVNKCDYTVTMKAPFLLDKSDKIIGSDSYQNPAFRPGAPNWSDGIPNKRFTVDEMIDNAGGLIQDFQESWSIEPEEGNGNTFDPYSTENITRVYRLTRSISAKGTDLSQYDCFAGGGGSSGGGSFDEAGGGGGGGGNQTSKAKYKAYNQARNFVVKYIQSSGSALNHSDDYPSIIFASGAMNLIGVSGFNHSRTENIDVAQGTYSIQDTWILSSGNAYENYTLSLSNSITDSRNTVSIEGTIKGLTSIPASGSIFAGNLNTGLNTPYENAINKYRQITNDGAFGLSAWVYKRAQNAAGGFKLNHVPLSVTVGTNEFTGEISYNIEYDDRPLNLVSGAISENISVTDTYPGDVFSIIPVIGRPTGPVLQYIGGRTEYQRSLSIELIVPLPSGTTHRDLYLRKPSLREPTRTSIIDILRAYHPGKEPGVRKYFCSPPQEVWEPKEGRYSFNVTWTYELNY